MRGPRYTDVVQGLPASVPFVGPEALERARGAPFRARLGANESVFGPSPHAVAAMGAAAVDAWMYGDPEMHALRAALAAHEGVPAANIVIGGGIDGLLRDLVRLLVGPGDAVVTSDGAYPTFNYHVAGHGGTLHKVPYRGDHEDPEALLAAAARTGAKLVYLSNPDNPMGSWQAPGTVEAMLDALPEGCVLCLDEAYAQFLPAPPPRIAPDDPRVIRLRTFSKAYGLAGLRVGHGICAPGMARAFDRVRNHFGVGRMAQAGALAALEDGAWLARVLAEVAVARARIGEIAAASGLRALPSAANFVAVDCGRGGDFARRVLAGLLARGVFVRMPGAAPLDRCIRIGAGRPADLDILAGALPAALAEARGETGGDSPDA